MNIQDIPRTVSTWAAAVAIATVGTVSACGTEVPAPAQQIKVEVPDPTPRHYEPACNTRAAVTPCPGVPPVRPGTRNRMRFDDEFAPGR